MSGTGNESNIFEENDLYILGNTLKNSIFQIKSEFDQLKSDLLLQENQQFIDSLYLDISTDDIYTKTIEEDVEEIIKENREKIANKKKIFNLDKNRDIPNFNSSQSYQDRKPNHLRSEAKILEDSIKGIELPTYQELKNKKYMDCTLFSYHFFKQFCKKEIGKENNYIFNFKDSFLNEMTKIDKEFFEDYFKFASSGQNGQIGKNLQNFENSDFQNKELIYEFAIYHPFKNTKTQQISLAGSCKLYDLKDKIYCVLDEIHSNSQSSFFFIENTFYNDTRFDNKTLSSKISENKIRKLNISSISYYKDQEEQYSSNHSKMREENKFDYRKELYSSGKFSPSEVYDEISMNDYTLNEIYFRIGYPYLYRHIDYCDHMIMLIDVRISDLYDKFAEGNETKEEGEGENNISDSNASSSKNLVTYQKKLKRRLCDGCVFYYAKFISINDRIGGDSNTLINGSSNKVLFFCEFCLKKLHEKEIKENTLGSLKLIPYYHD
jgi:RNase P subunit RPR2